MQEPLVPDPNYIGQTYLCGQVLTVLPGATVAGIDGRLDPGGAVYTALKRFRLE